MAHQNCGAVKGAIDDVHLGNITSMLAKLKPAVEMSQSFAILFMYLLAEILKIG
jgi:carbonic anhydrase